ncbi:MAG: class I SAM-dependent methyltransferase [FCB group bacterium]|nr:class I SAM-dependent methyltransferase [FCB group bacterium]
MKRKNPYDLRYSDEEYYWSGKPSAMCDRLVDLVRRMKIPRPRLLDLGCGEGQNAVYFARKGFDVTGIDLSRVGLAKAERLATEAGTTVAFICADLIDYKIDRPFDIIFSSGAMQYIPPANRALRFKQLKDATGKSGVHVMSVLVEKPFLPLAPDAEDDVQLFVSGELMGHYGDWEIIYCIEEIFDCRSSGVPHRHAINRVIARRYGAGD